MKILVTGGYGFIGTHLVRALRERGHTVAEPDGLVSHIRSLAEPEHDVLIHLAAKVSVSDSMKIPGIFVDLNSTQTALMTEQMGDRFGRLIVASSAAVYGSGRQCQETDPVNPQSVYALTKFDQERLCQFWGKMHGRDVVALRLFNVYGPGMDLENPHTGLVANFLSRIVKGEPPIVYEDGQQLRDLVYVDDVVEAFVKALDCKAGVYNVCTGVERTVSDVCGDLVRKCRDFAKTGRMDVCDDKRPGDVRHLTGDPTFTSQTMGWTYSTDLDEGLRRTVEWARTKQKVAA